ncbi:ArnT family glycosyltransferase [Pseudomonas eucalypticola]|uniref:Glycosyltransferase family 39 protein n=1 Tax=Pseudomonas eucalypticola TaxID=2599595 RepID=A0A7D5H044_9PSED|nr:glycosyltransferase family 39 protein [Pseudomonas eucalypticola]QKZ04347.1 glycosyltransferase family 39 protein [Pseudomonas eucalypticola]
MLELPAHASRGVARQAWCAGLIALVVFMAGVWGQAPVGFDSRFFLFAQEMLRHGPTFFPTTYGEPYPDYSATSTFFVYLLSLPLGQVNSFSAWLPSAIAAAVTVALLYRLVAPYSRQWALISIALLALSGTFVMETRAVSQDLMLTAVALAVFYLGYACDHFHTPRRLGAIAALLILGFAIRGPIGLVVPTGMLCAYYLVSGQWRRLFAVGFSALVLLGLAIGLLLWLARLSGGDAFVTDVVHMQVTGRIDGSEGASGPLYYFISSLGNYALAYPLALLVLAGAWFAGPARQGPGLQLLKCCAVAGLIVLLGLSVPQAKKARYVLPMLPMAAVIAGYPFHRLGGRVFAWLRGGMQVLWLVLPGLLLVGLLVAHRRFPEWLPQVTAPVVVLAVLQLLALALLAKPGIRAIGLAYCAVLALWSSYMLVFEPTERALYDTRQFSAQVDHAVQQAPGALVLHGMGKDAKAIKFMVNVDRDLRPQFTDSVAQLAALPVGTWVMMDAKDRDALHGTPLGSAVPVVQGRFDKDDYVLLRVVAERTGTP